MTRNLLQCLPLLRREQRRSPVFGHGKQRTVYVRGELKRANSVSTCHNLYALGRSYPLTYNFGRSYPITLVGLLFAATGGRCLREVLMALDALLLLSFLFFSVSYLRTPGTNFCTNLGTTCRPRKRWILYKWGAIVKTAGEFRATLYISYCLLQKILHTLGFLHPSQFLYMFYYR